MNFGEKFVCKLTSLGYPGAEKLIGGEFDWLYENDEVKPFLDWFCLSVHANNVLEPNELSDYAVLKASGETLLDGERLDEALANVPSQNQISTDNLRDEISYLKNDVEIAAQHLKIKQRRRLKFSEHLSLLNKENEKLSSCVIKLSDVHEKTLSESLISGSQFSNLLADLNITIDQVTESYERFDQAETETRLHFSQLDLNKFHSLEELFNSQLKNYITKQFFQGVEKMAATNSEYCYQISVKKPNMNLVQGINQEEYLKHCYALNQLCKAYPDSKFEQIDAQTEERRLESCITKVLDLIDSINCGRFPTDENSLLRLEKENRNQFLAITSQVHHLRFKLIDELVKECASSLAIKTITGDYTLKVIRQKYVLSKLDKVVEYLINQRARCEILALMFEIEFESHQEMRDSLESVMGLIGDDQANLQRTLETLPQLTRMQSNFETESYDSMCNVLRNLLVLKQIAPTPKYYMLLEKSKELRSKVDENKLSVINSLNSLEEHQTFLENCWQKLENATFPENNSLSKRPFSPNGHLPIPITGLRTVEQMIIQLRYQLSELETKVFSHISEHNAKQKLIKKNKMLQTERKLFYLFYTDPKTVFAEIEKYTFKEVKKTKHA